MASPARSATERCSSKARAILAAVIVACVTGCHSPVASQLDEPEANRVLAALDRAQVAATKELDPTGEGKFRVVVGEGDAARAIEALRSEELPRRRPSSVLDATQKGSLIPTPLTEQAQLAAGIAGDLERSLESVDGVLSARVHLNMPPREPLRDTMLPRASASVLLAHRGTTPPLTEAAIQRLVAGGAPALSASDVAVILVPRGATARVDGGEGLARLGPFGVARSSLRPIQVTFAAMLVALAALAATLVGVSSRLARLRAEDPQAKVR